MFRKCVELWKGEQGAVLSTELALIIATMLIAADGLIVGLTDLTQGVNSELSQLGTAIGSIPVSYSFAGMRSCTGQVSGASFSGQGAFGGAVGVSFQPAAMLMAAAPVHAVAAEACTCNGLVPASAQCDNNLRLELEVLCDQN